MILINLAAFQEDYHNPALRAADVAQRYQIAEGSLAEFAQNNGILTRKALGIKAQAKRGPKVEGLGGGGCRPSCPGWIDCSRHMGREAPLCEIMAYLDENPALLDAEPAYGGGVPMAIGLYFLEDEL